MRNISFKRAILVLFFLCGSFLMSFYSEVLFNPNHFLFSPNGDGISSYYNSYYHIVNDSSYLNFEGMNYPFGEHFTYSLNNPLLTNLIKFFNNYFEDIADYTIGIFNLSMLLSFIITAFLIFLIFEEFKINRILSVFAAISMMALSPQVFRMMGHLSLSYSFVIPLSILILIKNYRQKQIVWWYVILFINLVIWILVHPYYCSIIASFLISFSIFEFFLSRETFVRKLRYSLLLITIAILPLVLYKLFLILTDNHQCRTDNPYGFFVFLSGLKMIFIPHHPPLKPLLDKLIIINQEWEGWAYIGLSSIITIIFSIFYIITQRLKFGVRLKNNQLFDNKILNIMMLSSVIVVFFSMALPFKYIPGYLPDTLRFLKEFRSLGRFAWVFYFISIIFCTYIINKYLIYIENIKNRLLPYLIIFFFCGFMLFEAIPYHLQIGRSIVSTPNYFKQNDELQISKSIENINLSKYQAIISLPFYHSGSENFSKPNTNKVLIFSELISFKCSLPLVSSCLARTSIQESKLMMQLLSPECFEKPIQHCFPNHKPFLILYTNEVLSENEKNILKKSQRLIENKEFAFYSLDFDSLFVKKQNVTTNTLNAIIYNGFETKTSQVKYKGNGSLIGSKKDFVTIHDFIPDSIKNGHEYLISFWMYNCGENCGQDMLNSMVFFDYENENGEYEWLSMVNPNHSEIIDGCWSQVNLTLKIEKNRAKTSKLKLVIKGDGRLNGNFIIDELLVIEKKQS